jgi:cathepsin A (carboxypeptidase C)
MASTRKRVATRHRHESRHEIEPDRVLELPGYGKLEDTQFAGYAPTSTGKDAPGLFYWFVGAPDWQRQPTILWTNGGPGSSSFWGFFLENGPFLISPDGAQLRRRPLAWNQFANYLIFEHPLSVTLSFAKANQVPLSVEQGVAEWYEALLAFVARHPAIAENPIILAGESYAGTYLPLLAQAILQGNHSEQRKLDLRAMVLCDAWVDPMTQMATDTTYALHRGIISAEQKRALDASYHGAALANVNAAIATLSGCYMANLAERADPPFAPVLHYLNRAEVRRALHVPSGEQITKDWSPKVAKNYQARVNDSYLHVVQDLLDNSKLRVRCVSGLNDAKDCNFLGTGAWLDRLTGDAAREFRLAPTTRWHDRNDKTVLGFEQSGGQLGWLKVLNAGHMAAMDQPELIHYVMGLV